MRRVITLTLAVLPLVAAAESKDLIGVFQDALKNDPVIRQADANRRASREGRPQALAALLPQLNGTASITRDHQSGFQDEVTAITNPANPNGPPLLLVIPEPDVIDTTTKTWGLKLTQNVFSWSNWMALKAANAQVAQAEATYQAAEQQLILRVGTAYFNVLTAVDTLEADQAALEAIARQQDQAEKRFDVGLIAITDVEDARAARDTAAATVIADKRALATSEDQLQEITGEKYDRLAKPGDDMPLLSPEPADESRWVDISLEQNPTLISSRLAADIARDNVRVAIGGHLPSLDILAGRSYTYNTSDETLEGLPFNGVDNKINDRQITLELTVPLFSGGLTQSKVRQAEYLWIAAKEGVVQSSRATERQARDAYLGVISGIAHVRALRQALASNQTALKATEAGYEVGTRTSVDLLNARRNLVQAQTNFAVARYDYIVSVLTLRVAAGNLDRPELTSINNWLTQTAATSPAVPTPQSLAPSIPASEGAPATPPPPPPQPPPGGGQRH